jgi:hypothetical protein
MDSGPQNAVMGEQDLPTNLPETKVPDEVLAEEKKLAKYSQTAEFKRLKDFMENRIKFYQRYLPNGSLVEGDPKDPMMKVTLPTGISPEMMNVYWMAACLVTKEFENVLAEYAQAAEVVKDNAGR